MVFFVRDNGLGTSGSKRHGERAALGGGTGMSTLSVVEEILRDANQPLSVREIVERAGAALQTKSKTPDTVVARDLAMDIKRRAEESLFIRSSPGRYTLRSFAASAIPATTVADSQGTTVMSQALGTERAGTLSVTAPQAHPAQAKSEDTSISA
jgi:hypothetical protein